MNRALLTDKIVASKNVKGISWKTLAEAIGLSPGFATAALLGQMSLSKEESQKIGQLLDLNEDEIAMLQQVPYRGSLPTAIPIDPLIYRFYEITQVFGSTLKALIEEEFGDGIMSAIDFEVDVDRVSDPKGDRAGTDAMRSTSSLSRPGQNIQTASPNRAEPHAYVGASEYPH
jgi:cyanate lyase